MKFRRIYWVTEQLDADGKGRVTGVFTSIPDLLDGGMRWESAVPAEEGYRLTLVKLDSCKMPLGTWQSPEFSGLEDDLQEYVKTGEFSPHDCELLVSAVKEFAGDKQAVPMI